MCFCPITESDTRLPVQHHVCVIRYEVQPIRNIKVCYKPQFGTSDTEMWERSIMCLKRCRDQIYRNLTYQRHLRSNSSPDIFDCHSSTPTCRLRVKAYNHYWQAPIEVYTCGCVLFRASGKLNFFLFPTIEKAASGKALEYLICDVVRSSKCH